jgi:hypothetical protein
MRTMSILLTLSIAALAAAPRAQHCLPQPEAQLLAPAASPGYASALAMDGNRLVVGAFGQSGGTQIGKAFVYERIGGVWTLSFTWQPPTVQAKDSFARNVAISGDVIVASASSGVSADSSFYVLEWNGSAWVQTAHELAPPGEPSANGFGGVVAVSGQRLLASNLGTGRVLVYDKLGGTWTNTAVLDSDATLGPGMGITLALDGDRAVAGELQAALTTPVGLVHVFDFDGAGWSETALLKAKPLQLEDHFGAAVAVSGERIVVGAPTTNAGGPTVGAVHEFALTNGAWTHVAKLQPSPPVQGSFGASIALQGDQLLVGDPQNGFLHGRAYVFEDSGAGFQQGARFRSLPAGGGEAAVVALSGDTAALSAGDPLAGARVTLFDVADCAWSDLGGAKTGGPGLPALYGYGTLATGSGGSLLLTDALGFAPVMFFVALGPGSPHPFKGGTLLAYPPLLAVFLSTPPSDPLHGNEMALPFTMPAGAEGLQLVLQAAIRDNAATHTVALSNALSLNVP